MHSAIDDDLVGVDLQPGEFPRIVFRPCRGHHHTDIWQQRPVRAAPVIAERSTGRLAYFNNSKTMANSNVLQIILRDHGYERVENKEEGWSIFWCAGQVEPSDLCCFQPHQKVNKFPRASALTLKSNLWACFARMLHKHGPQHYGYMPQSFVLPAQMSLFEELMQSRLAEPQGHDDVWILKPAAAYCGRGIFLHRPSDLRDCDSPLTDTIREHRGVACRYIDPPYLIDGLKSDIRIYVLVPSFHPLTCYLYDEGLARFATEPYGTSDLDRRCMHLTNYSLNKHSRNFVRNVNEDLDGEGSKWSLSAFRRRLREDLGEARAAGVWKQVDDLVVKTLIAAEPTISESMRANVPAAGRGEPNRQCFQVFGFDVMLDAHAKPWLLEVNLDPSLRTESPLDLKIKSQMLIDLLNIVGMSIPLAPEHRHPVATGGTMPIGGGSCAASSSAPSAPTGGGEGSRTADAGGTVDVTDVVSDVGGSGAVPTAIFDDACEAAADWKRRRAADVAADAAADASASEARVGGLDGTSNPPQMRRHTALNPAIGPAAAAAAAIVAANSSSGNADGRNTVPAGLTGYDAVVAPALSDLEQWYVFLVNAEFQRSKKGKWRRLFPSERSAEYFQFFDPNHKLHFLPYGV